MPQAWTTIGLLAVIAALGIAVIALSLTNRTLRRALAAYEMEQAWLSRQITWLEKYATLHRKAP